MQVDSPHNGWGRADICSISVMRIGGDWLRQYQTSITYQSTEYPRHAQTACATAVALCQGQAAQVNTLTSTEYRPWMWRGAVWSLLALATRRQLADNGSSHLFRPLMLSAGSNNWHLPFEYCPLPHDCAINLFSSPLVFSLPCSRALLDSLFQ